MTGIRSQGPVTNRAGVRYTLRGPRLGGERRYERIAHSLAGACRRAITDLGAAPVGARIVLSHHMELAGLSGPGTPTRRTRLATLTRAERGVLLRPVPEISPPRLSALRSAYQYAATAVATRPSPPKLAVASRSEAGG